MAKAPKPPPVSSKAGSPAVPPVEPEPQLDPEVPEPEPVKADPPPEPEPDLPPPPNPRPLPARPSPARRQGGLRAKKKPARGGLFSGAERFLAKLDKAFS